MILLILAGSYWERVPSRYLDEIMMRPFGQPHDIPDWWINTFDPEHIIQQSSPVRKQILSQIFKKKSWNLFYWVCWSSESGMDWNGWTKLMVNSEVLASSWLYRYSLVPWAPLLRSSKRWAPQGSTKTNEIGLSWSGIRWYLQKCSKQFLIGLPKCPIMIYYAFLEDEAPLIRVNSLRCTFWFSLLQVRSSPRDYVSKKRWLKGIAKGKQHTTWQGSRVAIYPWMMMCVFLDSQDYSYYCRTKPPMQTLSMKLDLKRYRVLGSFVGMRLRVPRTLPPKSATDLCRHIRPWQDEGDGHDSI